MTTPNDTFSPVLDHETRHDLTAKERVERTPRHFHQHLVSKIRSSPPLGHRIEQLLHKAEACYDEMNAQEKAAYEKQEAETFSAPIRFQTE
jgi:hypothetical protein